MCIWASDEPTVEGQRQTDGDANQHSVAQSPYEQVLRMKGLGSHTEMFNR